MTAVNYRDTQTHEMKDYEYFFSEKVPKKCNTYPIFVNKTNVLCSFELGTHQESETALSTQSHLGL